jgi:hypothetical protein
MAQTVKIARGSLAKKGTLAYGELFYDTSARVAPSAAGGKRGLWSGNKDGTMTRLIHGDGENLNFRGNLTTLAEIMSAKANAEAGDVFCVAAVLTPPADFYGVGTGGVSLAPAENLSIAGAELEIGTYLLVTAEYGIVKLGGTGTGKAIKTKFDPSLYTANLLANSFTVQDALQKLDLGKLNFAGTAQYNATDNVWVWSTASRKIGEAYLVLDPFKVPADHEFPRKASDTSGVIAYTEATLGAQTTEPVFAGDIIVIKGNFASSTGSPIDIISFHEVSKYADSIKYADFLGNFLDGSDNGRGASMQELIAAISRDALRYGGEVSSIDDTLSLDLSKGNTFKYTGSGLDADVVVQAIGRSSRFGNAHIGSVTIPATISNGDLFIVTPTSTNLEAEPSYTPTYGCTVVPLSGGKATEVVVDDFNGITPVTNENAAGNRKSLQSVLEGLAHTAFRYGGALVPISVTLFTASYASATGGNLFRYEGARHIANEISIQVDDELTSTTKVVLLDSPIGYGDYVFVNWSKASEPTLRVIPVALAAMYLPIDRFDNSNGVTSTLTVQAAIEGLANKGFRYGGTVANEGLLSLEVGNAFLYIGDTNSSATFNYASRVNGISSFGIIRGVNVHHNDFILVSKDMMITVVPTGNIAAESLPFDGNLIARASPMEESANDTTDDAIANANAAMLNLFKTKAGVDSNGKIFLDQIPDTVIGAMDYQGTYGFHLDAGAASLPTVADKQTTDALTKGDYWVCTAGATLTKAELGGTGTDLVTFNAGDWLIYNGNGQWDKLDQSESFVGLSFKTVEDIADGNNTMTGDKSVFDGNIAFESDKLNFTYTIDNNGVPENKTLTIDQIKLLANKATNTVTMSIPAGMFQHNVAAGHHAFKDAKNTNFFIESDIKEGDGAVALGSKKKVFISAGSIVIGDSVDSVNLDNPDVAAFDGVSIHIPFPRTLGNYDLTLPAVSGQIALIADTLDAASSVLNNTEHTLPKMLVVNGKKILVDSVISEDRATKTIAGAGVAYSKGAKVKGHIVLCESNEPMETPVDATGKTGALALNTAQVPPETENILPATSGTLLNENSDIDGGEWI